MNRTLRLGAAAALGGLVPYAVSWTLVSNADLGRLAEATDTSLARVRCLLDTVYSAVLLTAFALALFWLALLTAVRLGHYAGRILLAALGLPWLLTDLPFLVGLTYGGYLTALAAALDAFLITRTLLLLHSDTVRDHCRRPPPR